MNVDGIGVAVGDGAGVGFWVGVDFRDGFKVGDGVNVVVGFGEMTIVGFGVIFGVGFDVILLVGFAEGVGFEDDSVVSPQPARAWVKKRHNKTAVIELLNWFVFDIAFTSLYKKIPGLYLFSKEHETNSE